MILFRAALLAFLFFCAIVEVGATTVKAVKSMSLYFEPGAVALAAADRERIAHFVADLRAEAWCPVVAVMVHSYGQKLSGAREYRSNSHLRLHYVVGVLRRSGLPVDVIYPAEGHDIVERPVVEVEAVGVPWHEGCLARRQEGFHLPEDRMALPR